MNRLKRIWDVLIGVFACAREGDLISILLILLPALVLLVAVLPISWWWVLIPGVPCFFVYAAVALVAGGMSRL